MDRRRFHFVMLAVLTAGMAEPGLASEGGGGSSGSGGGGGGSSGSGGGEGGDGGDGGEGGDGDGDNSGPGGGDDGDDDDNSGSGRRGRQRDEERAKELVKSGKAMPLRAAMDRVSKEHRGRVIDAKLKKSSGRLVYEFKVLSASGNVRKVRMDAVTGRFSGFLGF